MPDMTLEEIIAAVEAAETDDEGTQDARIEKLEQAVSALYHGLMDAYASINRLKQKLREAGGG